MNLSRWVLIGICMMNLSAQAAGARHHSASASTATSAPHKFGLGVVLFEPTSISGEYWRNDRVSIDAGVSFFQNNFWSGFADYLYHFPGRLGRGEFAANLVPYVGGGAFAAYINNVKNYDAPYFYKPDRDDTIALGLRVPLGINWMPRQVPLGIFGEFVPGLLVTPSTTLLFAFGLGARYYF